MKFPFSRSMSAPALVLAALGSFSTVSTAQRPLPRPADPDAGAPPLIRQALAAQRAHVAKNKRRYQVGHTEASGRSLQDLTGLEALPPEELRELAKEQNELAVRVLGLEARAKNEFEKTEIAAGRPPLPETRLRLTLPAVSASRFDWTEFGKVTPARRQLKCGSCWAFASVAALESSIAIREGKTVDASEQFVLDAALHGSCNGGTTGEAFTTMMLFGVPKEGDDPYKAKDGRRDWNPFNPYRALIWGFVGNPLFASPAEIKAALLVHGPVTTSLFATEKMRNHTNGVYDEFEVGFPNHVVLIVGWDDAKGAWKVKNSWGGWGENQSGFGWIAYGCNGIGVGTTWVEAFCSLFALPKELREFIAKAQKLAAEAEREARAAAEAVNRALADARARAEQAKAAAERTAREAAARAAEAERLERIAAQKAKELAEKGGRDADKQTRQALADAARSAREAAAAARKGADKAKKSAEETARDAADRGKEAVDAVAKKVKVKKPKLPKF